MISLQDKFNVTKENYKDEEWLRFLTERLKEVKASNYYEIMGVPIGQNIDHRALTLTYRQFALRLHPDKNKDKPYTDVASELLKLVNNAYTVLKDPEKEEKYRLTQPAGTHSQSCPKPQTSTENYNTGKSDQSTGAGFSSFFQGGFTSTTAQEDKSTIKDLKYFRANQNAAPDWAIQKNRVYKVINHMAKIAWEESGKKILIQGSVVFDDLGQPLDQTVVWGNNIEIASDNSHLIVDGVRIDLPKVLTQQPKRNEIPPATSTSFSPGGTTSQNNSQSTGSNRYSFTSPPKKTTLKETSDVQPVFKNQCA